MPASKMSKLMKKSVPERLLRSKAKNPRKSNIVGTRGVDGLFGKNDRNANCVLNETDLLQRLVDLRICDPNWILEQLIILCVL
jgi:hypothetical protein